MLMKLRPLLGQLKRNIDYALDLRNNILAQKKFTHWHKTNGYRRVYHYHIRKTAGTSLNHMFLSMESTDSTGLYKKLAQSRQHRHIGKNNIIVGWNKKLLEEGLYSYGFSHIPFDQLKLPANTFTITVIRDPLKRILSLYRMLLEESQKTHPNKWFARERGYLKKDFIGFFENLPKSVLQNQLYMFSNNFDVEEAAQRIKRCNCWLQVSEFSSGVNRLNNLLGTDLKAIHLRSSKIAYEISEKEKEKLTALLRPEYQLIEMLRG